MCVLVSLVVVCMCKWVSLLGFKFMFKIKLGCTSPSLAMCEIFKLNLRFMVGMIKALGPSVLSRLVFHFSSSRNWISI